MKEKILKMNNNKCNKKLMIFPSLIKMERTKIMIKTMLTLKIKLYKPILQRKLRDFKIMFHRNFKKMNLNCNNKLT
jgi:hypothetical protein